MSTENLLNQAVKGALAFGAAGSLVGAGAALAQTAAPASATAPAGTNLSTITVVGSRVPQTAVQTAQPVVSINRQQIEATGFTTVGQLLNNLGQAASALNTQFNNGGNGAEYVNLHDLGSNRTLVLVDGQRWSTGLGNAVDLTTIPLGIVDHVDVLLDGASAIYGSDAIAGVVNIITVKNFNGARADAYLGAYNAHGDGGGWDGKTQEYNLTIGTSSDRSSVLFGAGYRKREEIRAGNRNISKEPNFGVGKTGGSALDRGGLVIFFPTTTPGFRSDITGGSGVTPDDLGCVPPDAVGGLPPQFVSYCAANGPFVTPDGSAVANPHPFNPETDAYNFAPVSYLRTPEERWYLYSQGHYDLTDSVTFDYAAAYNERTSQQILAGNPFNFGAAGANQQNGLPIGVSGTNKYNPFGVDLVPGYYITGGPSKTATGPAWCSQFGTGANGCTSDYSTLFLAGFRPTADPRVFSQDDQTYYFRGGFNGYWQMAGNQWTWDAHYVYSKTNETEIEHGLQNTQKLQRALGPADDCTGSCVPFNLFGGQAGVTKDMYNYVDFRAHNIQQAVVRDYNANIGGSFFNGWYAGPWGLAAGYEYYEQDGFFEPDAIISAGNTDGNVAQPTNGKIKTNAEYGELSVPFAHDLPGAKELGIDIAERWSQFKWHGTGNLSTGGTGPAGGSAHSSTGRVTLKYRPVSQLLLRASWSQGFRAPSVSELFSGAADSYEQLKDPCAPGPNGGWDGNPADLPSNCPAGGGVQPTSQILTSQGGNVDLSPEKAISKSVGFVYSPKWAPGLDFSLDYYHVDVTNNITVPGGQFVLNGCYPRNGSPNPAYCALVTRPGKTVTRVLNYNVNAGSQTVRGFDAYLNYKLPTTPIGNFTVHANANILLSDVNCGIGGDCSDSAGTAYGSGFYGQPRYRYSAGLSWDYGPWSANWTAYVIGDMWENCSAGTVNGTIYDGDCSNPDKRVGPGDTGGPGGAPSGQNHLGVTIYHDVQASYTVNSWNTTFTLGVNNLFNKTPPISRTAFANSYLPVYYRTPGRFIYGRISVDF
jgi:iron complex outermembrane receptor protein